MPPPKEQSRDLDHLFSQIGDMIEKQATTSTKVENLVVRMDETNNRLSRIAEALGGHGKTNWGFVATVAFGIVGLVATMVAGAYAFHRMAMEPITYRLKTSEDRIDATNKKIDDETKAITKESASALKELAALFRDEIKREHSDMLTVWASAEARITRTDERLSRELNEARKQIEENSKGIAIQDRDGIEIETQFGRFADAINSRQSTTMSLLNQERRESQHEAFDDPQPWVAFEKIKGSR